MTQPRLIAFHFPHKCASTFAYKLLAKTSKKLKLPLFSQSNKPPNHAEVADFASGSNGGIVLRGPVRNFTVAEEEPKNPEGFFRYSTTARLLRETDYRAVCQTRDILDLVVSQYFSHGWIHPPADGFGEMRRGIQSGDVGLYEYALLEFEGKSEFGQESILEKYTKLKCLQKALGPERTLVLRYEEMVMDYDRWAQRIRAFFEDWLDMDPVLKKLRPRYRRTSRRSEFFPDPRDYVRSRRREMKHIRSPEPGDHRRFFSESEIVRLEAIIDTYDVNIGRPHRG